MIAIPVRQTQHLEFSLGCRPAYLGIVTPAFSHACIKAEPAVFAVISLLQIRLFYGYLLWRLSFHLLWGKSWTSRKVR